MLAPLDTEGLNGILDKDKLPPGMGGYNIVNLVNARNQRCLYTDVITLDPSVKGAPVVSTYGSVSIYYVSARKNNRVRDFYRSEVEGLCDAIRSLNPTLLHVHWTYEYALAAIKSGKKYLLTVHDHAFDVLRYYPVSYIVNYLISLYVLQHSKLISAVSPHIAEYAAKMSRRTVEFIPNCFGDNEFTLAAISAYGGKIDARTMVSALTWGRLKNVKNALRAFSIVRSYFPNMEYRLIGPGLESGGEAHKWAINNRVADGVSFLGRISHSRCVEEISKARVCLHPSLSEAYAGPITEALLYHTPVVAAKEAAGSCSLLQNGKWGRLVRGTDPKDIARGIMAELRCPVAMTELRERASYIRKLFNPDSVLSAYEQLYARLDQAK